MEGQGERSLEAGVGAREGALVAVGGETVDGVRPDLRLDALLAQGRERVVPAVQSDDVCLPPVRVALVGRREVDGQPGIVRVVPSGMTAGSTATVPTPAGSPVAVAPAIE